MGATSLGYLPTHGCGTRDRSCAAPAIHFLSLTGIPHFDFGGRQTGAAAGSQTGGGKTSHHTRERHSAPARLMATAHVCPLQCLQRRSAGWQIATKPTAALSTTPDASAPSSALARCPRTVRAVGAWPAPCPCGGLGHRRIIAVGGFHHYCQSSLQLSYMFRAACRNNAGRQPEGGERSCCAACRDGGASSHAQQRRRHGPPRLASTEDC